MKVVVGSGNNIFSQSSDRGTPGRVIATTLTGTSRVVVNPSAASGTSDSIARETANDAYIQANLAYGQANAAFAAANVANNGANTVHIYANGTSVLANSTLNFNNSATVNVNAAANGAFQTNVSFSVNTNAIGLENYLLKSGGTVTGPLNVNSTLNVTQQIYANTIDFGPYELASNSFQTTANTSLEVDSFSASLYSTVKYIVQIKTDDSVHSTELFCIQDGASAFLSEYATLISGSPLGNFTIQVSGGRVQLIFVPDNPLSKIMKVKLVRYTIAS